jgi:DNA polymerase-3 subunit epsilon
MVPEDDLLAIVAYRSRTLVNGEPEEGADDARLPYANLIERALRFVGERDGSVAEDALIAYVFGSSGSASMWQPLLRQILAGDERLLLRPDGRWSLARMPVAQSGGLLAEFVAVDVETTGLQPLRQRIIEVALVRFRDGEIGEQFSTLINPEKRIPKFISTLTGITDEQVSDAPPFSSIAPQIEEWVGSSLLVGHNVGFDINFLNAELARAGRVNLINDRLDVMGLASRLVPGLRRPSLDKVALHFGFNPRKVHRALVDAELAGQVAIQLAARAGDLGIDSIERLRAISRPSVNTPPGPIGRGGSYLDRSILADIPKCPGVYLMHDTNDRIVYIGKAKNLRERVSSYFSQPLGYTRKMDGLLESIARIETERTGSELAALLLESQLIRRYQPRYNVVMRASEEYPFIKIDLGNPWPRISLAKARKEDGSIYFGPFKSRRAVKTAVDLVNDNYPLRTCTRSFKTPASYGSPCIQLDLGKCLGPCVGRAVRDEYMRHVRDAVAFLGGDDDVLLSRLHEQLESSAERLDFERARRLRNSVNLLGSLVDAHRRLKTAQEHNTLLIVQPGPDPGSRHLMLVVHGQLWCSLNATPEAVPSHLAERLREAWGRFERTGLQKLNHQTLDDVSILNRWIAKADGSPVVLRFDPSIAIDWDGIVSTALRIPESMLSNPIVSLPPDEGDDSDSAAMPGQADEEVEFETGVFLDSTEIVEEFL